MKSLALLLIAATLAAASGAALAQGGRNSGPACGWRGGAMDDPGATQRCLAARYKPPKARAPETSTAAPAPQGPGAPAKPGG